MPPDRHHPLIDVATLVRELGAPDLVVVDCRSVLGQAGAGRQRYLEAHVPGAVHADLEQDLSGPHRPGAGRHPLPDPQRFAAACGNWGIGDGVRVVAYDDAGGAYAARLWWLLRWLGHDAVAVLDGGWPAWQAAGAEVCRKPCASAAAREFDAWPDDRSWLSTEELLAALAAGEPLCLVDARAAERYRGEVEPVDPVAGHIPGALNLPFAGNLGRDGRFLSAAELGARYRDAAEAGGAGLVCYCGSGVTACHNLLALELAGITGARLYEGSWSGWVEDPDRGVERA